MVGVRGDEGAPRKGRLGEVAHAAQVAAWRLQVEQDEEVVIRQRRRQRHDSSDDDDSSKTLASLSIILTVGFDCMNLRCMMISLS